MNLPDSISLCRLQVTPENVREALKCLSAEEKSRMATFKNEPRRQSFAVARLAARGLVAERMGCKAVDVALEVRPDGSLGLPGDDLNVSISHSGLQAVAVASPHPVGVDLEILRPRPTSLYRFMLHPDEQEIIETMDLSDDERIAVLWSIKESVLKGRRTGLRNSPKLLRIDPDYLPDSAIVSLPDALPWQVSVDLSDGYVTAVAWPSERSQG